MNFIIEAIKDALRWVIRDIIWTGIMAAWSFVAIRLSKHPIVAGILFLIVSLVIGVIWTTGF